MYGLDRQYATVVAFAMGCDAATDFQLLAAFNKWLGEPSIGWESQIVRARFPDRAVAFDPELDEAQNRLLIDDLFDNIDRFLANDSAPG